MNKSNTDAPPIMVANRPIGIAFLSIVLLAIGWAVGHRMAIKAPTQALRSKIERELEREFERKFSEFERKFSDDQLSYHGHGAVMQTNELVRKLKFQSKETMEQVCNEQVLSTSIGFQFLDPMIA